MKTSIMCHAVTIALLGFGGGAEAAYARAAEPGAPSATDAVPPAEETQADAGTGEGAPGAQARPAHKRDARSPQSAAPTATDLESITVTGTRIRGGATPSPVITLGSERIRAEGFKDLGEVIRSVPQNFRGGQNPGVAVGSTKGAGGNANQNMTGGSSLNLRGLGPDATLTLLNGRRLAYGGFSQSADISAIPVDAVERIEIVPDGASAIYGSDAVGGVGNVILKRDYEGVAAGVRHGRATDGGLATREYTLTAGANWSRGGLIAAYKDVSIDPIFARQRDYTAHMFDPNTLYPGSDLRSAVVSMHHAVSDAVEFRLDALGAKRDQEFYQWNTGLRPFYNRVTPETRSALVSPGLEIALPRGWSLSVQGSHGKDEAVHHQFHVDIASGAATAILKDCYCNAATSYETGVEGPLFRMPGGEARLAAGIGGRRNELIRSDRLGDAPRQVLKGTQRSRFAYAELSLPLMDPSSGARRLELTAAVRGEDDDHFGRVNTPKLGVVFGPSRDLTFKYSWGKSFKAPTLNQLHQARSAVLDPVDYYGGEGFAPEATVLALYGGSRDLKAERAATRTASLAFHPEALPDLQAEFTWFDIDYTDRVVQPITDYARAMAIPEYAEFFHYAPGAQRLEDVLASADMFYNYAGRPYDPSDVVAVLYAQFVNAAHQRVRGVDLSGAYGFDAGPGRMTLRGAVAWLDSTQRNSAAQPAYDIAGTLFNPARVNGRVGAVWDAGAWSASLFSNYTSGMEDTVAQEKTASFTTFDATLRYAHGREGGLFSGVEVALSAQNVLDRHPPRYAATALDHPPYDSTNYSAIGRFLSLGVTKQW